MEMQGGKENKREENGRHKKKQQRRQNRKRERGREEAIEKEEKKRENVRDRRGKERERDESFSHKISRHFFPPHLAPLKNPHANTTSRFFDASSRGSEMRRIKIGIASERDERESIDTDYRVARNDIALCATVSLPPFSLLIPQKRERMFALNDDTRVIVA